jgi:hypothetical protein
MADPLQKSLEWLHKHLFATSVRLADSTFVQPTSEKACLTAPVRDRKAIGFLVDEVEPSPKPLWLSTLGESLEVRSGASILIMPDRDLPSLASEGYVGSKSRQALEHPDFVPPRRIFMRGVSLSDPTSFPRDWADKQHFVHPLIVAVHQAFSDHRPLILSPDAIWLTIIQGFSHHLLANPEAFRSRIVAHHGRRELRVETLSLEPSVWPQLISQLCVQIRDNSDPFLYETLACEFSTTTPTIKTAYEIALAETYHRYFEYTFSCICGIPKVILEGTPDDWQRVHDRVQVLATFDLHWWTNRLTPILDQFIASAKGAPDLTFWKAIYKPKEVYADERVRGWITDLFPYLGGSKLYRNEQLAFERVNWTQAETESNEFPGVSVAAFPSGISRTRVAVEVPGNSNTPVELLGGFFGVSQSPGDNALAPIISWAVVAKDTRISLPPPSVACYLCCNYRHLMTEQERRAYWHLVGTSKAMHGRTDSASQAEARKTAPPHLLELLSTDSEVLRLTIEGLDEFVERTGRRILDEYPDRVALNTCPRCGALARTPKAKQCRFCRFDWHKPDL